MGSEGLFANISALRDLNFGTKNTAFVEAWQRDRACQLEVPLDDIAAKNWS
jgi:hypothetical protein